MFGASKDLHMCQWNKYRIGENKKNKKKETSIICECLLIQLRVGIYFLGILERTIAMIWFSRALGIALNHLSKQHWGQWGITGNPLNDMEIQNPSSCLLTPCLHNRVRLKHKATAFILWITGVFLYLIILFMKTSSPGVLSHVGSMWATSRKCWPNKDPSFLFFALQFDVIRQDLWEDGAEASPQRAMENCAEHYRENNCSASTEWPEREFDQLLVSLLFILLFSSLPLQPLLLLSTCLSLLFSPSVQLSLLPS